MVKLSRAPENPILSPVAEHDWEANAAFKPSVIADSERIHLLYRAVSRKQSYSGVELELSTIGYAASTDGIHFTERKKFIQPEHDWEIYGCEDPRVTKIDDTYYIFYTALSIFPFTPAGIRVGVAITRDFQTIDGKYPVTPFNAKAMTLLPERINGKLVAILTVHSDIPPARICIAYFDRIEELWNAAYWENWYAYLDDHALPLLRSDQDHVEVGAAPVKTENGWLFIYSYIKNYFSENKQFTIEGALLDPTNPHRIVSRTPEALLIPETPYETVGLIRNVVFPSGAVIKDSTLSVYYGGADTVSCLATLSLPRLISDMQPEKDLPEDVPYMLRRFEENPILKPVADHDWEARAVFNPAVFYEDGKIHIVYRASSADFVSTLGYAESRDGFHITKRHDAPIYTPREAFEKNGDDRNYGCEDPRISKIDDTLYMLYTAYDGHNPPRVAITSLNVRDFLFGQWNWTKPQLISPPAVEDKDACLFPKKINDKYVFLHRLQPDIWIDFRDTASFSEGEFLKGEVLVEPRADKWDSEKIGIAAPPIETAEGWLLLYHGVDKDSRYCVGALLMDLENPKHIIAKLDQPIFTPERRYEREGVVPNVVFPCGALVTDDTLLVYFGGADTVVGVGSVSLPALFEELRKHKV